MILDRALRQDLDSLPRRAHDHAGSLGDSKEAGLKAIMSAFEKKDYLEMPMSHL